LVSPFFTHNLDPQIVVRIHAFHADQRMVVRNVVTRFSSIEVGRTAQQYNYEIWCIDLHVVSVELITKADKKCRKLL